MTTPELPESIRDGAATPSAFRLLHLHTSPFSERVRWVLESKRIAYTMEPYEVGRGEERLMKETGQRQVPVLYVDGSPRADSTAIVDWLEEYCPTPRLVPEEPAQAAQVHLYEALANRVLAPDGRQLVIGRMLAVSDPRTLAAARFFQAKYGHSDHVERSAREAVRRALTALSARVVTHRYLVGDTFTRADLTVAAMLLDVVPPSEDLFVCDPPTMRSSMTDPSIASDPQFAGVFAWRDRIYRDHRGAVVRPHRATQA